MQPYLETTATSPKPLPAHRALAIAAAFIVCYVVVAWVSRYYLVRPFAITPWNPVAGIALALLLVYGLRFWPALAIASLLSNLMARGIPAPPYTQLLTPCVLTAGYVGMAALLRGPLGFRVQFDRLRDIAMLVAVAAFGTLLIAIAVVSIVRMDGRMPPGEFNYILLRYWIGHLIGIVVNTPLLLLLAGWPLLQRTVRRRPGLEAVAQFCAIAFTLWIIFGLGWADKYKFFYLLFLPLIWIAMRHGIVGAILGTTVIQLGLIVAVVRSEYQAGTAVTEFQFMMLAVAVTGLFLGMVVTENRAARDALADSESRLRAIVSTAPDSIITVDKQGAIVAANSAAMQIFGYAAGRLTGTPVHEVLPDFQRIAPLGEVSEVTGVRHDGSRFPAELAVGITGSEAPGLRIAITRDITRRKKMERELEEKQAELGRVSRLAAAGEMAAALAHELHQPLSAIRNYARVSQMLQPNAGGDLPGKIEREAARAAEVVQRLRDFFRDGASRLEPISVQRLIEVALAPLHEDAAQQHIALGTDVDDACGAVELLIDRIQVETVIHRVVSNAIEAIAGSGVGVRTIQVAARRQDNGWIRLSVTDSGPGISPAIAARLFEPFATTKLTGIGMGLAMSRSMVEAHGGELWVESAPGGGTIFYFTLPPADLQEAVA